MEAIQKMTGVETRSVSRDSLFLLADIRVEQNAEVHRVRVRNLSDGGMMGEGHLRVQRGHRVSVELRNVGPVAGRVIWAGEGKFGIAFDRPVDPQAVRRQVVSQSDLPPHLRRTGLEQGPFYRRR